MNHRFKQANFQNQQKTFTYRYYILIGLLLIATVGLLIRLVDLTVIKRAFLQEQGDARTLRTINVPAYRGIILDRNGESLAISTPVDSVWINPEEFDPTPAQLTKLASFLDLPLPTIRDKLNKAKEKEFIYLKRSIDPDLGAIIKSMSIPGLYLQREYRRFYPEAEVMAHVLGFTNIDDNGQEGLELGYNTWLQGVPGLKRVLQDRLGRIVSDVGVLKDPRPGRNLNLSIDRRLQYFAYHELEQGAAQFKANSGSVVVLDIKTGEILAMVNWPSFNPNNRTNKEDAYRNRAVTDLFEPGSTIKTFGMASALSSGKYQPTTKINTSPGWMIVNNKRIEDEKKNNGTIDLTTILQISSNVGMSKVTLSLSPNNLWNTLHSVGFGDLTSSNFPGERSGYLPNYKVWNPFVLCTLSFGYGMSATVLQLAQAYAVLANDGIKVPVSFLREATPPQGQQVLDPKVAHELLIMLESVLMKGGTAPLAKVPGYRVTGKTGTARILGPNGYEKGHHNSFFVGIAPASNPQLVIAVFLHDPEGGQYMGGYTSGPIFSHIMGEALRLMNIPPDDLANAETKLTAHSTLPPQGKGNT